MRGACVLAVVSLAGFHHDETSTRERPAIAQNLSG
jgi:hypothetical protein